MSATFSSVVDAPRDEVFDWHARPGAIHRLMPPWQPVRVVREADSLRDGRAVLGMPLGLRWTAQHGSYDPPSRFVDELTSVPLRWAAPWRHQHEFAAVGDDRTRVTDTISTPVPAALLRSMFAFRHHRLAADLAAQRAARDAGDRPATIAVTGSGGLIGSALIPFLTTAGHRVIRLVRRPARSRDERQWRPEAPAADLLTGVDALVHLAGASIAGRFTDAHRAAVRDSRIGPTERLAELAASSGLPVFVSASAIGYYGADRGDTVLEESSGRGDGFLADVVADWEAATRPAAEAGTRVVTVRTGIVQSPSGGALRLLRPLFTAGLGGKLGDGTPWQSWIGIDDLVDVYHRALYDTELRGPVNAVAPNPVRNSEYTAVLARVLRRPALLPVPDLGPKLILGADGAREVAFASQRVRPGVLDARGHRFRHPGLEAALRHVLGRERMPA
jgi:uncharacterized protein (TIGR01777 family)